MSTPAPLDGPPRGARAAIVASLLGLVGLGAFAFWTSARDADALDERRAAASDGRLPPVPMPMNKGAGPQDGE